MILDILWLIIANPNIDWIKRSFQWRTYTAVVALMTTCRVNIIELEDFAELAINKNVDCFAIYAS